MQPSIQLISIESFEFYFFFNEHGQPTVHAKERQYHSLFELFQDFPILVQDKYLAKTIYIINFLLTGLEFQIIENIEKFREDYLQQIEVECLNVNHHLSGISHYGIFEVSDLHPPILDQKQLIFFVKNDYNHLPYKVTIHFPVTADTPQASYAILPFV